MKARHFLLTLSILGIGLAGWTVAEPGWGGGPGHRGGRGHLLRALELSEDQQAQLKVLREQHRETMKPQREAIHEQVEAGTLTREEAREQMRSAMESHRVEVEKILTPEQVEKLAEMRVARQERMAARGDGKGMREGCRMGRRHGGRGHLLRALELSEDQQAQLKALREQHRETMKPQREAIRAQVEEGTLTREEAREQMRAAMESHRAEVEKILTPEQLQKLEELRANRPKRGQQSSAGDEQGEVPKIPTEGTTVPTAVESQSWGKVKDSVK